MNPYKKVRFHEMTPSTTFEYSKTDLMNNNPEVYRILSKIKELYWILLLLGYKKNQSFRYKSITHVLLYKQDTSIIRSIFNSLGAHVYSSLKIPVFHDPSEYISFGLRHTQHSVLEPLMDSFVYEYKDTINVNDIEVEEEEQDNLEDKVELKLEQDNLEQDNLEQDKVELKLEQNKLEQINIEQDVEQDVEQIKLKEQNVELKLEQNIEKDKELETIPDLLDEYEHLKKRCSVIIRSGIRKGDICNRICVKELSYCGIHYYYNK
jgi:type III secretory pathway component EscV